jgi:hypothetical protein
LNKIALAIEELHRSENSLARDLMSMSDRHKADHEVFHLARDLAGWSEEHVAELARVGRDYGLDLDGQAKRESSLLAAAQQKVSELVGRRPEPGLLLLTDLRHLYRDTCGVSLDWEVLAQAAQAKQDRELLALAERCHPQTLRQSRWANAKIKETAAQALLS